MTKTFRIVEQADASYPFALRDEIDQDYGSGFRTRQDAENRRAHLEWEHSLPVGLRTGGLLVDVRAVRSKALTTARSARRVGRLDAEDAEILADLEKVVALLDRWQRTSKPPRPPEALR